MIKKLSLILLFIPIISFSQVGIGTVNPDASSSLDISSTSTGILIPRMTEVQRDAIASPATGLLIYQTNNSPGFYYYDGTDWLPFDGSSGDNDWTIAGANMYNGNSGNVGIGTTTPTSKLHLESIGTPTIVLNQTFESSISPLVSSGAAGWNIQTSNVYTGASAAGSGNITHGQDSSMEYTVTVPTGGATLTFASSVSSEQNYDFLNFYINGVLQNSWSGTVAYTSNLFVLAPGTQTLTWTYEKDGSVDANDDAAYVDDIVIIQSAPPALRIVDGNESEGLFLVSDAYGNATWKEVESSNVAGIENLFSVDGLEVPMCNTNPIGNTGSFTVNVKTVPTTVTWTVIGRRTTAGSVVTISGQDVLAAPFYPQRLQVRYDFSPALPFNPGTLFFGVNNTSSFPDTFSINYAAKSDASITVNITRTDVYGDQSSDCWAGQFFFDMIAVE